MQAVTANGRVVAMQGSRALVVGLGVSGLSAARWLASQGCSVAVTDSRERPPQLGALAEAVPDAALFVGGFSEQALDQAEFVVLSPGVARSEPYVQAALSRGLPVIGDIELFACQARAPVVAVTGSNGKSTVATLVGMMAERAGRKALTGGNLGKPALDLVGEDADLYVLELSSFQLESVDTLDAAAAALLNVSADHLDRYPDVEAYADAKARVWRGGGVVVANRDDPRVVARVPAGREVRWFGANLPRASGEYGLDDDWLYRGDVRLLPRDELHVRGLHNATNALAAWALGDALDLPHGAMAGVLREFRGLPHRMELVAEINGVAWYDDSKATNVGAAAASAIGIGGTVVMLLGGDGKGQDFTPLAGVLQGRARAAVVLGRDAARISAALQGTVPVFAATHIDEAVRLAADAAHPGDSVLLAPACSSLDMFENFEARGRAFAAAVRELVR